MKNVSFKLVLFISLLVIVFGKFTYLSFSNLTNEIIYNYVIKTVMNKGLCDQNIYVLNVSQGLSGNYSFLVRKRTGK